VEKAGRLVGINLKPHDLRRHAATYASRSGTPLEIVSKVILRHANLSTTQRYLGKVSDMKAMRWIENLYGEANKNGVRIQNTSPLPMIVLRCQKYRFVSV
jgi:integrase